MRGSIIAFALVISLFVLSEGYPTEVSENIAASNVFHFSNLAELATQFSAELRQELGSKRLFLEGASVRELGTSKTHNFSLCLQNELESSLSRDGFILVYEMADADYLIGAAYQRLETSVRVFFKYHRADLSGKKGRTYEIEISRLPKNSFEETIHTKAYELASNILAGHSFMTILFRPLYEANCPYPTDFSTTFSAYIKNAMVRLSKGIHILDEKPDADGLAHKGIIAKGPVPAGNLTDSDAKSFRSTAVLDGKYFDRRNDVSVHLYLRDLEGKLVASTIVDIDKSLIKSPLENKIAKKLAELLDEPLKKEEFCARVFTPKGRNYPIYYEGETIQFHIQVEKPLYVYLYAVNSKGDIVRLFPFENGGQQSTFSPGRLYKIPAEQDDFEIKGQPPFGVEAVKIFAANAPLPLPYLDDDVTSKSYSGAWRIEGEERAAVQRALSQTKTINPMDLVDYYRGIARRLDVSVYEDSMLLETRKK